VSSRDWPACSKRPFVGFLAVFWNTKGFWSRVFIPILSFIFSFTFEKRVLGASDWGFFFVFPVSFPSNL
jgi:hypothetical protein